MLVDFAIHAERSGGMMPEEAIYQACIKRFHANPYDHHGACWSCTIDDGCRTGARKSVAAWICHRGRLLLSAVAHALHTPVVFLYSTALAADCGSRYHRPRYARPQLRRLAGMAVPSVFTSWLL